MADGLAGIAGIAHGFFTRQGGYSTGLYASLNCGLGSGDDKASVKRNRSEVAGRMGVDFGRLLTVWQWHSADVQHVETPWDPVHPPRADAMVTDRPGIALGVLTADCAPVLLASADGRVVGAAHAGWKGALGGVLEATVEAMLRLGADLQGIRAAIGPTISQANYEVGAEFRDRFLAAQPDNDRFFSSYPERDRFHFDLPAYARARLERAGVAGVADTAACTYAEDARYFSYRRATHRGEPDYGRQISAIAIVSN